MSKSFDFLSDFFLGDCFTKLKNALAEPQPSFTLYTGPVLIKESPAGNFAKIICHSDKNFQERVEK